MDGPPRNYYILLLTVLVVLSAPVAAVSATPSSLFGVQSVDPDQVLLRVDVQESGDAQWRVEYRVRLDTENETEAFESLKQDIENNESAYLSDFRNRIRSTVATAENATGRNMSAEGFNVSARITQLPQKYGVLTYTFTWTNFAVVEDDRLIAGDALAGFFLDSETTLAIGWPESYEATTVTPEPSERRSSAVLWRGPLDFGDGQPRVFIEPASGGTTTTDGGPGETTSPPGGDGEGVGIGESLGILLVVLLIGAAGFRYYRRHGLPGGRGGPGPAGSTNGGGPGPGGAGAGAESTTGEAAGAGAGSGEGVGAGAGAEAGAGAGQEPTPEELLSNEERVVQFLEERGGRAKQQEIVDGLGWTDAKTSQVLSGMASDDQIEKFRIGRENVVKLPDGDDSLGPSEQ